MGTSERRLGLTPAGSDLFELVKARLPARRWAVISAPLRAPASRATAPERIAARLVTMAAGPVEAEENLPK
jgi:hypothetical protein